MQIDMNRFRETFFEEADEHIAEMEAGLLRMEKAAGDPELLNAVFRGAHSIKGASGTFGFEEVARFTHALESLLDRMRNGEVEATRERLDLLLRAVDTLKGLLAAARSGGGAPPDVDELLTKLTIAQRADRGDPREVPQVRASDRRKPSGELVWQVAFRPAPEIFLQGMEPALVLRELAGIGELLEVRTDTSSLPGLAELQPETCWLGWTLRLRTARSEADIRDVFAFVEDGAVITVVPEAASSAASAAVIVPERSASPAAQAPRDTGTIRVATEKVDKLIDLVGELVISQSMAAQILNGSLGTNLTELREAFGEIERHTRELQERVMSVRMLPIGSVFGRFPRLVRDLAVTTGKEITLELTGEETELDKSVVEQITDPLMHLIRNAADHGIEGPSERALAGKTPQGTIRLQAWHQGGSVIIEVADDGRGLDTEKIRAKATERSLIRPGQELSAEQIRALIFEPGFSTAEKVSDISGRGVGMDVVKRNVSALNGSIAVDSEPGRGTSVRIRLPLTLAILDGLLLRIGKHIYVLSLLSILESIRPRREQVKVIAGGGEVVLVRGEPLPLVRLHQLLGVETQVTDASEGLVVIVEYQERRLALLVDELLGQQQVVIKSLETHFRRVEGVAGATILGDGQAALILDVAGIAQMARSGAASETERQREYAER